MCLNSHFAGLSRPSVGRPKAVEHEQSLSFLIVFPFGTAEYRVKPVKALYCGVDSIDSRLSPRHVLT